MPVLAALGLLAVLATPTPMATPRPRAVIPAAVPQAPAPRLAPPRLMPRPTPRPAKRSTPRPQLKPTPKPRWHPPRGVIYVDGTGLYPSTIRLRYGRPLRFIQTQGRTGALAIVAVDPHQSASGVVRELAAFPITLTTSTRWAWLGDGDALKHRHWTLASGTALTLLPDTFLALHDEIWDAGIGSMGPARFLLYVVVDDKWRKLVVTLDR